MSLQDELQSLFETRHGFLGALLRLNDNIGHCFKLTKLFKQMASSHEEQMQLQDKMKTFRAKDISQWSRPEFGSFVRKLVHTVFETQKENVYLTCKTVIELNAKNCQDIMEEIDSEFKIIYQNEKYSEDIKLRLIYELRIRLEKLEQKLLDSIVEAINCLTKNHQLNFSTMLKLDKYFENIRSDQSKKLMLPVENKIHINVSVLGKNTNNSSLNPFSFISSRNVTSSLNEESFYSSDYSYSQMGHFFDHDFSLDLNQEDLAKPNLIIFIVNQTNIKTFTNNRALVGSKKKDFVSMLIVTSTFEDKKMPIRFKFDLPKVGRLNKSDKVGLYPLTYLIDKCVRFRKRKVQKLYSNKKTESDRIQFLNSLAKLELEFTFYEPDRRHLTKGNNNLYVDLVGFSTPYLIDADWHCETVKLDDLNFLKVTLRLEFFHFPKDGKILFEFQVPASVQDVDDSNNKLKLERYQITASHLNKKVIYNQENDSFEFKLFFEHSSGTDGFQFDLFLSWPPETANEIQDFLFREDLIKLVQANFYVPINAYFLIRNPFRFFTDATDDFTFYTNDTPTLGIVEFIHLSHLNYPRPSHNNLENKLKELTEDQSFNKSENEEPDSKNTSRDHSISDLNA